MERVHLDFIGPLPRTERGNEHILMMVDQFTYLRRILMPLPTAVGIDPSSADFFQ
jgi:hypothetical protein